MHDTLVIGCGHGNHCWDTGGGGKTHLHLKADTLNIEMGMNPSVIALWGHRESNDYFSNHRYQLIADEGPISYFMNERIDDFFATAKAVLSDQGKLLIPDHLQERWKIILKAALKCGFEWIGYTKPNDFDNLGEHTRFSSIVLKRSPN
jgi:hypothetical protein